MYKSNFSVAFMAVVIALASGKTARTLKNHIEMSAEGREFLSRVQTMPGRDDMDMKILFDLLSQIDGLLGKCICQGDKCGVCINVPVIGKACIEVESVKNETGVHFILTRDGHELFCITLGNSTPKICLFHHLCVQLTDIHIANGAVCASLQFNGSTILHKCIHF